MKKVLPRSTQSRLCILGILALCTAGAAFAQHKAIGFKKGMPFSDGYIAGNTLYVAGQQGPYANGKVTGTDITLQTTNAIACGCCQEIISAAALPVIQGRLLTSRNLGMVNLAVQLARELSLGVLH
jgi:enamine deaminase RidA (YjgF/YER057c/UK114 family)